VPIALGVQTRFASVAPLSPPLPLPLSCVLRVQARWAEWTATPGARFVEHDRALRPGPLASSSIFLALVDDECHELIPGSHLRWRWVRVRVEIMGSHKCRIAGKSQSVLIMTNPIIFFTRTRTPASAH
jgi:hypothetical protein